MTSRRDTPQHGHKRRIIPRGIIWHQYRLGPAQSASGSLQIRLEYRIVLTGILGPNIGMSIAWVISRWHHAWADSFEDLAFNALYIAAFFSNPMRLCLVVASRRDV